MVTRNETQIAGTSLGAADEASVSSVSWAAIIARALTACGLSLFLIALGAGLGFSVASPWPGAGISPRMAMIGTGLYLIVIAMLASTIGGYLAGRLRTKWSNVHTDEVYFRDTAHGLVSWALATLLTISVLGASGLAVVSAGTIGATAGLSQAASTAAGQSGSTDPNAYFVDTLFRSEAAPNQPSQDPAATRSEVSRILSRSLSRGGELSGEDRAYVTRVIADRTGIKPEEADKRLNDTVARARAAADEARKFARNLSLWIAVSLLLGAFVASLAAAEAGKLRDDR